MNTCDNHGNHRVTSNHDNLSRLATSVTMTTSLTGSMDLVAGHTLSISIATLIFANSIGTLIDRIKRLTAIRVAIGKSTIL